MRYAFKMESIGEQAVKNAQRRWVRGNRLINKRDQYLIDHARELRPWLARIDGFDEKYGLARTFLSAQKDYTTAEGAGNRGAFLYYWLEPGIYEINQRISVKCARRFFLFVADHQSVKEITRDQVEQWLLHGNLSESVS